MTPKPPRGMAFWARLCAGALLAAQAYGYPPVDWNRHCIEGELLSDNFAVRAGAASPISVWTNGTPDSSGVLVDGRRSGVRWTPTAPVEITLDLGQVFQVTAVVVSHTGRATWRILCATNTDAWRPVAAERVVELTPEATAAANLAMQARFIRVKSIQEHPLLVKDVWVFGETNAVVERIGPIYPSTYPPVARVEQTVRATVRNPDPFRPQSNVVVEIAVIRPEAAAQILYRTTLPVVDAHSTAVVTAPWTPRQTEPHEIRVSVSGTGTAASARSVLLPVVARPLYFASNAAPSRQLRPFSNLYTTIGGGHESFLYYLVKFRGLTSLAWCNGPHVLFRSEPPPTTAELTASWSNSLHAALRDGVAMDEWSEPYPAACEAFAAVARTSAGRWLVPWLSGTADATYGALFQDAHVVLDETYLNMLSHVQYRNYLNKKIGAARRHGLLDRWIIALGVFAAREPSTLEEIARELRYVRARAPEMRGIAFYSIPDWMARGIDDLAHAYFIAPVITWRGPPTVEKRTASFRVWNIGGMTASNVRVVAFDASSGKEIGWSTIATLEPGGTNLTVIPIESAPQQVHACALAAPGYTVLAPPADLEVLPAIQNRGGPIHICWTPDSNSGVNSALQLEIRDRSTNQVKLVLPHGEETWALNAGNISLGNIDTTPFSTGPHLARIVNTQTGRVHAEAAFAVTEALRGRFRVSRVNGAAWPGNPHHVRLHPGDTFEVAWDMDDTSLSNPIIHVCPPGVSARDAVGAAPLSFLAYHVARTFSKPMQRGAWTWKTNLEESDLLSIPKHKYSSGWIRHGDNPNDPRINMARNPGRWQLWIGTGSEPKGWSVPATETITIDVAGDEAEPALPRTSRRNQHPWKDNRLEEI